MYLFTKLGLLINRVMFRKIHFPISKISSPNIGYSKKSIEDIPNIKHEMFYENFWNTLPDVFKFIVIFLDEKTNYFIWMKNMFLILNDLKIVNKVNLNLIVKVVILIVILLYEIIRSEY